MDKLYEPFQIMADSVMVKNGFSDENWMTKKFEGHDHSERSWNSRLHISVKFLLSK